MAKSIIIDPGHGGTDPGANGFGVREKDWNLRISLYQYERLKELGANVAITRTTDKSLDSVARTNLIKNKYDIAISNHWNAFNGSARGVETIHSIHGGKQFATNLGNAIVKASGLPLRRVFSRRLSSGKDYYFMHRLTGTTRTIIIEYGFIDNKTDHDWFKNDNNFYKAAEAVIEAVCKEIGVKYVAPNGKVASKPVKPASKPKPVPQPAPKRKSVGELIKEVEAGKHGNGEARKKSLGSRYQEVQSEINRRAGLSIATPTRSVNVNAIAEQIKKGIDNQGRRIPTGHEPRRKHFGLTKDEYAKVRARVNQIM